MIFEPASQFYVYLHSVFNVKALEGTFNQEKAPVGALFEVYSFV